MVEINQILTQAVDIKTRLGWATETTLQKLYDKSGQIEKDFETLLDHMKIDEKLRKKWHDEAKDDHAKDSKEAIGLRDDLNNFNKSQDKATRKLGFDLAKSLSKTQTDKASGLFDTFAHPLKTFSDRIQFSNAGLFKWTNAISLSGITIGELYNELQNINTSFKDLYASGARLDMSQDELIRSSTDAGLTFTEYSKLLTKYGNLSVSLGVKGVTQLSKGFAVATKNGADLMMSNEESQTALFETLSGMQSIGALSKMNNDQLIHSTKDYLTNLNDLSAATGTNRDEIAKMTKSTLAQTDVNMVMRMMPKEMQATFRDAIAGMNATFGQQFGTDMAKNLARLSQGGVGAMDKKWQLLVSGLGNGAGQVLMKMNAAIKANNPSKIREAQEEFVDRIQNLSASQRKILMLGNPEMSDFINGLEQASQPMVDRRNKLAAMTEAERKAYLDREKFETDREKDRQAAFNDAQKALSGLRNAFYDIIVKIEPVLIPALEWLTSAIEGVTSAFTWLTDKIQKIFQRIFGVTKGKDDKDGGMNSMATLTAMLTSAGVIYAVMKLTGYVWARFKASAMKLVGSALGKHFPKLSKFFGGGVETTAEAAGGGVGKAAGSIGEGLGKGLTGIGNGIKMLGSGIGKAALGVLSGLARGMILVGKALGPLGTGIGKAIYGILSGISSGIATFGNGRVLLGSAALLIIAGSMWVASEAFLNFAQLKWEDIAKGFVVVGGMGVLGAIAGVASPLLIAGAVAIGALGLALIPFAIAARIAAPAFEEMGKAVKLGFEGIASVINAVGNSITNIMNAYTNMKTATIEKTTDQIERLSKIDGTKMLEASAGITAIKDALAGFSPGILSGFNQFIGGMLADDPVEKLQKLADIGNKLGTASTQLQDAAKSITSIKDALAGFTPGVLLGFTQFITDAFSNDSMSKLQQLADMGNQLGAAAMNIDKFKSSMSSILNPNTPTATPVTQGNFPTITTDQLNVKTLKYYEDSIAKFNMMLDNMERSYNTLELMRRANDSNATKLAVAIGKTGNRV